MMMRLLKVYLVLTVLAVFYWLGTGFYYLLQHNAQQSYCVYSVEKDEANYEVDGLPCRIRFDVLFYQFGAMSLIYIGVLHSPVYLYLLVRFFRRRRYMSSLRRRHETRP